MDWTKILIAAISATVTIIQTLTTYLHDRRKDAQNSDFIMTSEKESERHETEKRFHKDGRSHRYNRARTADKSHETVDTGVDAVDDRQAKGFDPRC